MAASTEAQKQAIEALGLHLYGMEKDGDELPDPSKTPEIDPETAAGFLVSPITVFPELVRNDLPDQIRVWQDSYRACFSGGKSCCRSNQGLFWLGTRPFQKTKLSGCQ
ncbi:MAG: type II toxin-antitoxin system HicB family antitoxin [Dethiobacteria bacterium]